MRAAIIQNGIVVNVTNTQTLDHPDGLEMIYSDIACPGWAYVDGKFTAPTSKKMPKAQMSDEIAEIWEAIGVGKMPTETKKKYDALASKKA